MKFICLFIGILLTGIFANAQQPILRLPDTHKSELYFINVQFFGQGYFPEDTLANKTIVTWDKSHSYSVNDASILNKLTTQWLGIEADKAGCLHDYDLYVFENSNLQDIIEVNETCRQAQTNHALLQYSISPITLIDTSQHIVVAHLKVPARTLAKEFVTHARQTKGIIMSVLEERDWYKFDEEIIVETRIGNSSNRKRKVIEHLRKKFPTEAFEVEYMDTDLFRIRCTKLVAYQHGFKTVYRNYYENIVFYVAADSEAPIKLALQNWQEKAQ